jgi:hypothetical protein
LRWHQVFNYEQVADIAWQFASLSKDQGIQQIDLHLEVTTLSADTYDHVLELETYFPKIKWSGRDIAGSHWAPVIYLAQQLYQCAS